MSLQSWAWCFNVIATKILPLAVITLAIMLAIVGVAAAFVCIVGYFIDKLED